MAFYAWPIKREDVDNTFNQSCWFGKHIGHWLMKCVIVSDDGSEVVFEIVVSTDKPDYIAIQESSATKYPLII